MKKKGWVFLAAGLGLLFMWPFGSIKAGPVSQAAARQSAEASNLAERQFAEAVTLLKRPRLDRADLLPDGEVRRGAVRLHEAP
jgi:hypothetical protein